MPTFNDPTADAEEARQALRGLAHATIRIDDKDQVWVNDKKVSAKKSDGALVFKEGMVIYRIQGDRRLKGEDGWVDNDAGTKGPITAK